MAKIVRQPPFAHLRAYQAAATDFPEVVNFQFLLHLHFSFHEMLCRAAAQKKMIAD
jgi:hypothetical protein